MKKTLMTIAALLVAAGMVMVSCQKPAAPKDDNALVDDETPGGDQPGGETPGGDQPGGEEPGDDTPASLKGSNYYLIVFDGTTYETIKDKVVADYRPDNAAKNLYVWEGTYVGGEASGLSFYGTTEGWVCLKVTSVGWSGAGWNINNKEGAAPDWVKMKNLATDTDKYYLHVGYKGAANDAHILQLNYGGAKYTFAVGEGSLEDSGVSYSAIAPVNNGGKFDSREWNEYEVKLSDMGIDFSKDSTDDNVFVCLSGGTTGKEINLDAVFIYKK